MKSFLRENLRMDLTCLIEALSDESAYPVPAAVVSVHQTHISVVFKGQSSCRA